MEVNLISINFSLASLLILLIFTASTFRVLVSFRISYRSEFAVTRLPHVPMNLMGISKKPSAHCQRRCLSGKQHILTSLPFQVQSFIDFANIDQLSFVIILRCRH